MPTIENPLALLALITGLTAFCFRLEHRYAWAQKVGSSLLIIIGGAIVSNLSLVPFESKVYSAITGPVTSLAIVWLLFAVDLRGLKLAGPRMVGAFAVAVLGTSVGALVASLVIGGAFPEDGWRLAGVMTGTYAGGSLNFVSVGRAVELPESLYLAAVASDNVMTAVWVGATLMLPVWLGGIFRARGATLSTNAKVPSASTTADETTDEDHHDHPLNSRIDFHPISFLTLITLGLILILLADFLAAKVPLPVPSVLWLTTVALILGQWDRIRRLKGAMQMGLIALNLFFAVIGILCKFEEILRVGMEIFYFTAIVVLIHGVVTYAAAWLLRIDVETTSVASQAAVGGPSTALALAATRGWRQLQLPGLMVGLLGYAVGTYAGLAVANLVRHFF